MANPKPLVLRAPIEPRVDNVQVPEDHPLWQFFADKQYMRKSSDITGFGNSWTIPQLRRKSFDDLHTLWYVCLKEWNRLGREQFLVKQWMSLPGEDTFTDDNSVYSDAVKKVRESMWRIRHVLAERYHGFRKAELELGEEYPKLLAEFQKEYLEADSNADAEVTGQLERFQYAFFGINPFLEGNFPEPQVLKGLYAVARLKLARYASDQDRVSTVNDVREAFLLFTCEHTPEGVNEAIDSILEVRQAEPVEDELQTLSQLMLASKSSEESV